ncbi:MAG: YihY/virulence factor BrkB family protein [Verrucomicrobium sp.]|nr:YihY/virulence factor BrkB family protein [Verrucomicrobium sp.]
MKTARAFPGWIALLKESAASWNAHHAPKMGAALAYYTAFSLAPLITLVLSLASIAVKRDVAARGMVEQISNLVGASGGEVVQEILRHAGTIHALSWGTAVSLLLLLVSASGAFGELQESLNLIWEVPPEKHAGWRALVKERLLSFSMVFVLGFFMLTSLLVSTFVAAASRTLAKHVSIVGAEALNNLVSLAVITALFATLYRTLPAVRLAWRDVLPGALLAAFLFIVGKFLLGWYVAHSSFSSSYGAAGSFVVILFWVFYSAQILYFGAEFTRTWARHRGAGKRAAAR